MLFIKRYEVINEVDKINRYLNKCLWMDFEFCQMNGNQVIMSGSIYHSYNEYAIDIIFDQPYFSSSLFFWHTDTSEPFIQLVANEEEQNLIEKYDIEQGNYIFKISAEGFEEPPIYIAAKKITCNILNTNPFPE